MHESKILKCRNLGCLRKTVVPLTHRYKSMLAKRLPVQVLTARGEASLLWSSELRVDRAVTSVSLSICLPVCLSINLSIYISIYKVRSKINETFVIQIFLVAPSVNEVVRWKVICLPDFQWQFDDIRFSGSEVIAKVSVCLCHRYKNEFRTKS